MPVLSVRVSDEQALALEAIAKATDRKKSFFILEGIDRIVEENAWQIQAIEQAIKDADAGLFAKDEDVEALRKKWLS